jgi:hypothetical protein
MFQTIQLVVLTRIFSFMGAKRWFFRTTIFIRLACAWGTGTVSGLLNTFVSSLWFWIHLADAMGVAGSGKITAAELYWRMTWCAIWGLLYVIPDVIPRLEFFYRNWKGILAYSLLITFVAAFTNFLFFLPREGMGFFGVHKGKLFWILVLLNNASIGLCYPLYVFFLQRRYTYFVEEKEDEAAQKLLN